LPVVLAPLNRCMLPTRSSKRRSLKVYVFLYDNSSAHIENKDDGHGVSRTPTFGRVMSDLHRRDTSLTNQTPYGDPRSKIWGLYLSQAEKFDKEHSESWTANTDGVLVFVRLTVIHPTTLYFSYLDALIRPVFSPPWWLHSSSSVIRCYSPIQLIPPINSLPKSPNNYPQMGPASHRHLPLLAHLHSDLPLLQCV
jgi:hypothetical protein